MIPDQAVSPETPKENESTQTTEPSQDRSKKMAYEFCVKYDQRTLRERAKIEQRPPEEIAVLTRMALSLIFKRF